MVGRILTSDACMAECAAWLAAREPAFARALETCGPPPLRRREDGFPALLGAIVSQQVSTAAARAIWARMEAARLTGNFCLPKGPTAAAAQREALRACQRLEQEAARLRSQAAKERQIAKQVDLNLALQRLQADLNEARARL